MKILLIILFIFTASCSMLDSKPQYIKKPIFNTPYKTINLNEYKSLSPYFVDDSICYSKEDYLKLLYLINDLKNYIQYQKELQEKTVKYYDAD